MATYFPPKRATAYIIYIALESVATAGTFQSNPTIASGDFKVSLDGGSLANLTTLPTVTPASGKMVKISLSSAEMTADNVTIVCSDVAGSEWKDLVINLATVANQNDDLATPTNITAGTITTATNVTTVNGLASGVITATSIAADAITAAKIADGAIDAATFAAGAINAAAIATDAITAAKIAADAIGASELAADAVTEIQSGLGTSANQTTIINALTAITSYIDTEIATLIAGVAAILDDTGTTGVVLSTATKQAIADMVNSRGMSNIDGAADKYSIYHLVMSLLNGKQAAGSWTPYTTTGTQILSMAVPVDTDIDALPVVGTHGS